MPSNGQPSFLHDGAVNELYAGIGRVSMPSNGQPSFLLVKKEELSMGNLWVSMPSNGQPSFLLL